LQQYYDLELQTDLFSLNTGRVFAKIGFNEKADEPTKLPVSFVVIDNQPHLTTQGVVYLAKKSARLFIITTNKSHPAFSVKQEYPNVETIFYEDKVDFSDLFVKLRSEYGADKITIQSGGVREGLVDRVLLVVAPAFIGGKNTSTLLDGAKADLSKIKTLEFVQAKPLNDSYLLLEYKIRN